MTYTHDGAPTNIGFSNHSDALRFVTSDVYASKFGNGIKGSVGNITFVSVNIIHNVSELHLLPILDP